jgi:hypothetical protein
LIDLWYDPRKTGLASGR